MKEEKVSGGLQAMKSLLLNTSNYSSGWSLQLVNRLKSFHLANVEDFIPGVYVNQLLWENLKIRNRKSSSLES